MILKMIKPVNEQRNLTEHKETGFSTFLQLLPKHLIRSQTSSSGCSGGPEPTTDWFELVPALPQAHFYNLSGRLGDTGNLENSECTLQVSMLNAGYYIARVTTEAGATASASVIILK